MAVFLKKIIIVITEAGETSFTELSQIILYQIKILLAWINFD